MSHSNSELWHLLFELEILSQGKIDVRNKKPSGEYWPTADDEDFNPEHDEKYSDAMLKAKESQQTVVRDEDDGEWNLL